MVRAETFRRAVASANRVAVPKGTSLAARRPKHTMLQ